MKLPQIDIFKKTYGKEKTLKVAKRYAMTFVAFLVCAFFAFFAVDNGTYSMSMLMLLFMFELVYGCYMLLSLRVRKLEEKEEELAKRLKK